MMTAPIDSSLDAPSLALSLELSHGPFGAGARVEVLERDGVRLALVELRGWIDAPAVHRLEPLLDQLAVRGVNRLVVDCARVRHIDYRVVPTLVDALGRFDAHAGGFVLCGLSHYLRDLFRLAGREPGLRCWPSAAELLADTSVFEPRRECAS
jgi:anti-anti-sigma factor